MIKWTGKIISIQYGIHTDTFMSGFYEGVEVVKNVFVRDELEQKKNDISYKIVGVTGWIKDKKQIEMLLKKTAKEREIRRTNLRDWDFE